AAEFPFGTDLARHARHFARERVELVHHDVDGVLQIQNFAAHVYRDLASQIAACNRGRDFRDVTNLRGEVAGHRIYRLRQILPHAGDALHVRLAAKLAVRADFAGHARDFRSERIELVHHDVNGVLQLQNFTARIHRDLRREVALGYRRGHLRDVTHLVRQVAGHGVHRLGEVFPRAAHAAHNRLTAKFAFGTDFAGH